jgi:hypothetical protein
LWLFKAALRTVKVTFIFLSRSLFKLVHLVKIVIANWMIINWISIIILENVKYDSGGQVLQGEVNTYFWALYPSSTNRPLVMLDVYSELARLHRLYSLLAVVCCACTYWRVFQFFSFSLPLSMLSETLLSARADILHFLFMYTLLLVCFALTAMSYFGANLPGFSTLQ